ncbi:proline-rich transmembrane protein 1-like [Hydra vulgaris]|uniref:proline-rich transmembrane protein 1-like n=1 Tax=Hydra vulgaris TaxID=6087 RepID=UPI0032EA79BC
MELDYRSKFTEPTLNSEAITVQVQQPVGGNPFRATVVEQKLLNNYGAAALLSCICCFWPLGVGSLWKSNEVDTAVSQGDITRAQLASRAAKNYAIASVVCGIFIIVITILKYALKLF